MNPDILSLYKKYDPELRQLAYDLRPISHRMQAQGYGVAFGDVDGEIMYMLLRETQPISPLKSHRTRVGQPITSWLH